MRKKVCKALCVISGSHSKAEVGRNLLHSHFDPDCVKTSLKPEFVLNLRDFSKLQFAKALISLKLKFGRLGFNHN